MELDKNIIVSQIKSYFSKSKKVDFPSLISYTTNIKSVDYYKLLDNNKNNVFNNKIFWEQDYNSMSFCALGHEINYNNQKYSKETINNKIIKTIRDVININNTSHNDIPLFIGGQNFDTNQQNINIWKGVPSIQYIVPKVLVYRTKSHNTITFNLYVKSLNHTKIADIIIKNYKKMNAILSEENDLDEIKIKSKTNYMSKEQFDNIIDDIKSEITNRRLKKVVVSNIVSFKSNENFSLTALLKKLKSNNKSCSIFYYKMSQKYEFLGATPELIMKKTDNHLRLEALAGSVSNNIEDRKINSVGIDIMNDKKINLEHDIVVDGIIRTLKSVNLESKLEKKSIVKLKNLMHLKTKILSKIDNPDQLLTLLDQLTPTAALSGYPKEISIEKINTIEKYERGWYSGVVGWVTSKQNCEYYAAIRSAFFNNQQLYIYAGAGITSDSNSDDE